MRIGLNLRPLFPGKIGGLEHHFRGLLDALIRIDTANEYVAYVHDENRAWLERYGGRIRAHRMANPHLPSDVARAVRDTSPAVVLHPFLFIEPAQLDAYNVVLIPDVRYAHYPEQIPPATLKAWRKQFPDTARRADAILTLSRDSRRDVIEILGVDPAKVHITSPGVDPIFFEPVAEETLQAVKARHNLPERFLYFPADTWPHKNHLKLFAALKRLKQQGLVIPLALSGFPNAGEDAVNRAIRAEGLEAQVIRLGYVPRADQPAIYKLAHALVFPSLYEGWGMPVSEAMAVGTPVMCSNRASIPEVGGDAALYFDAMNPKEMAAQIRFVWTDAGFAADLARRGPAQARMFTWERAAETTLRALEQAARPMLEVVDPLPLVTVVTPSYQQGAYIERTIESVLSQDYPHLEYLVVDGGSSDDTVEILKKYGSRVNWVSRKDRGQSDAINQGLRAARGEILAYLNSDDTYAPGAIRKAVTHMVAHPTCDVVYGQAWYTDSDDKIIETYPTEPFDEERLGAVCYICQPASFWRRRLHDRIGYFAEDQHLVMDYEFWLRAAKVARIAMLDDFLATSRLWEGAKTVGSNAKQLYQAMLAVSRHQGHVPAVWINNYVSVLLARHPVNQLPGPAAALSRKLLRKWMKARLGARFNGLDSVLRLRAIRGKVDVYGDGWMGSDLQQVLTLGADAARLRINGSLPCWPKRHPPAIEVYANDRHLGQFRIPGTGPFQAVFPLPPEFNRLTEMQVRLRAHNTFVPADHGIGSDERRLSCHIDAITAES